MTVQNVKLFLGYKTLIFTIKLSLCVLQITRVKKSVFRPRCNVSYKMELRHVFHVHSTGRRKELSHVALWSRCIYTLCTSRLFYIPLCSWERWKFCLYGRCRSVTFPIRKFALEFRDKRRRANCRQKSALAHAVVSSCFKCRSV